MNFPRVRVRKKACKLHSNDIFLFQRKKENKNKTKKKRKRGLKGEVKNHNHMAGRKGILRKANLCSLEFVLLPLFFILHLAHFDFQARKLGH